MQRNVKKSGFTLVEILIVVIILGILAAIVIPQFTNASTEARENSLRSLLQTIRSQVELYKLQHSDRFPTADNTATGAWSWDKLTGKSDLDGTINAAGLFGPYLQDVPMNPLTNGEMMSVVADEAAAAAATVTTGATPDVTSGFVFSSADGKIYAFEGTNKTEDDADFLFDY
jgi:general secretion pathway protein G